MKSKLPIYKMYSALLVILFMVCLHSTLTAQITVCNETGCTITVDVVQNDYSTFAICDLCFSNPFTPVQLLNGECVDIFGQDECFEQWQRVSWVVALSTTPGPGISYNPALGGACGSDVAGQLCNTFSPPTSATWSTSGPFGSGPAEVIIE